MAPSRKSLKAKADRLWSAHIRSLGHCQVEHCRRTTLQAAHWISRRYAHTRHDLENGFSLCAYHHRFFTDHPTEFGRWAIRQRGEETYQRLLKLSQDRSKVDYEAVLERLEQL